MVLALKCGRVHWRRDLGAYLLRAVLATGRLTDPLPAAPRPAFAIARLLMLSGALRLSSLDALLALRLRAPRIAAAYLAVASHHCAAQLCVFDSRGLDRAAKRPARGVRFGPANPYPTTLHNGIDTVFRVKCNSHQKRCRTEECHRREPRVYA